ncbi:MAG: hypothetical protein AB7I27_15680 [Bacteriovoracaceae bacterium]
MKINIEKRFGKLLILCIILFTSVSSVLAGNNAESGKNLEELEENSREAGPSCNC